MLTPRMIEAFRAVILTGSVSAAAEFMHVSQPAVSRLIRSLEDEIGFSLFRRRRGRLAPTEDALTLFEEVQRSYVGLESIAETASQLRKGETGELRIAAMPAVGLSVLPQAISRFQDAHPTLKVVLRVVRSPNAIQYLTAQQCDIAVVESAFSAPSLEPGPRFAFDAVCVFAQGHPLGRKAQIAPADLHSVPFVSLDPDSRTRMRLDAIFEAEGIERILMTEAPLSNAVCALVLQGCGVSVVDPMTARMFEPLGLVNRPFSPSVPFEFRTFLTTRAAASTTCRGFIDVVREVIGERHRR